MPGPDSSSSLHQSPPASVLFASCCHIHLGADRILGNNVIVWNTVLCVCVHVLVSVGALCVCVHILYERVTHTHIQTLAPPTANITLDILRRHHLWGGAWQWDALVIAAGYVRALPLSDRRARFTHSYKIPTSSSNYSGLNWIFG